MWEYYISIIAAIIITLGAVVGFVYWKKPNDAVAYLQAKLKKVEESLEDKPDNSEDVTTFKSVLLCSLLDMHISLINYCKSGLQQTNDSKKLQFMRFVLNILSDLNYFSYGDSLSDDAENIIKLCIVEIHDKGQKLDVPYDVVNGPLYFLRCHQFYIRHFKCVDLQKMESDKKKFEDVEFIRLNKQKFPNITFNDEFYRPSL